MIALISLMRAPTLGRMKLGPEDAESINLANELRAASLEGRLSAVWTKVPHEVGYIAPNRPGARLAQLRYAKQVAMGFITGSGDYVFTWSGGSAWIEMKSKTNGLDQNQKDFRDWCRLAGVQHFVCRSAAEALAVLRELGLLVGYDQRRNWGQGA